ncbi:MAG: transporter [Alloprevotella sp.]|nr:transporter [Alloprevotella sp.]
MSIPGFLKNFTLPIAMAVGSVVYLVFALVPQLERAAEFFNPVFDTIFPLLVFFILLVTFCKVDFHRMRLARWHLWISLEQLAAVGLVVTVIVGLRLSGAPLVLSEGLLTCLIAPTAAAAAVVTAKLGGDLETMTAYTFLSNPLCALMVPLFFPLVNPAADMGFLTAFLRILGRVCLVLVLPMLLAYVIKHHLPRLHARIVGVKDLSFYIWAVSLSIVTGTTVKHILHAEASASLLLLMALGSLLVCLVQFAVGRRIGRPYGVRTESGQALGQKNTAFAIWMACTYLTPLSSVAPGCYILWQNIINSLELAAAGKRER